MKKLIPICALAFGLFTFSSCETCKVCSSTDALTGEPLEEEFCASGKVYDEGLERYEDNGWDCKNK